jgi:hypothetical protein
LRIEKRNRGEVFLSGVQRLCAVHYRDVLGGDAEAVGERGDPGGAAAQVVGEARREVQARKRAQE